MGKKSHFWAAALAVAVVSCSRSPTPPSPTAAATPTAAPAQVLTYDCHSPQKSRDIFLRFDAKGALYLGEDAADMQPTGDVVLFDKSGIASWSTTLPNGSETNSFDRNTGGWDWAQRSSDGQVFDQAHYDCKAV